MTNHEGKAREAILLRVIKRNHIRIRKNQFRNNQSWSIQLFDLTEERKMSLLRWVKYILPSVNDKFADVSIHQLKDNSRITISLNLLSEEYSTDRDDTVIIPQKELIKMYSK